MGLGAIELTQMLHLKLKNIDVSGTVHATPGGWMPSIFLFNLRIVHIPGLKS